MYRKPSPAHCSGRLISANVSASRRQAPATPGAPDHVIAGCRPAVRICHRSRPGPRRAAATLAFPAGDLRCRTGPGRECSRGVPHPLPSLSSDPGREYTSAGRRPPWSAGRPGPAPPRCPWRVSQRRDQDQLRYLPTPGHVTGVHRQSSNAVPGSRTRPAITWSASHGCAAPIAVRSPPGPARRPIRSPRRAAGGRPRPRGRRWSRSRCPHQRAASIVSR